MTRPIEYSRVRQGGMPYDLATPLPRYPQGSRDVEGRRSTPEKQRARARARSRPIGFKCTGTVAGGTARRAGGGRSDYRLLVYSTGAAAAARARLSLRSSRVMDVSRAARRIYAGVYVLRG